MISQFQLVNLPAVRADRIYFRPLIGTKLPNAECSIWNTRSKVNSTEKASMGFMVPSTTSQTAESKKTVKNVPMKPPVWEAERGLCHHLAGI